MNDDEIINLFLKRDENGIIELSTKYHPYCYKIAWNLLANREDAEELHIAKLNGRICGAKRSHSVFEQPNCYQSSLCNLILIMIVAISGMVNTSF